MDLKIIRNQHNIARVVPKDGKLLEISGLSSQTDNSVSLSLFDPVRWTALRIAPDADIRNDIPTYNCIWNCPDVYFSVYYEEREQVIISVYKYDASSGHITNILTFPESRLIISGYKKIKVFILSEEQILVQTEHQKDWEIHSLMGNIEFALTLYDINHGSEQSVQDINLLNNGIHSIIPVSATEIMVKTGYPFLEDERISGLSEAEALIESVYFGSMAMFISAMQREASAADMTLLGTVYFDKGIINPHVNDDYIIFSIINYKESSKETCFYNFKSGETLKAVSKISDVTDLDDAYVISNTPYIRNVYEDRTEFFNLTSSEPDCVFYEEKFIEVIGELFIFQSRQKNRDCIRIYRYPQLTMIHEEKGTFAAGCVNGDRYYIYVKD